MIKTNFLPGCPLEQQSPVFWAPGNGFVEDNFPTDRGWGGAGWFWDDSRALHLLCTLFLLLLHQLHFSSSDIRSQRLGTPALEDETQPGREKLRFGFACTKLSSQSDFLFQWAAHHDWGYICHHGSLVPSTRCPPSTPPPPPAMGMPRRRISVKWFLNAGTCIIETSNPREIRKLSLAGRLPVHRFLSWVLQCIPQQPCVQGQVDDIKYKNDVGMSSVPKELSVKYERGDTWVQSKHRERAMRTYRSKENSQAKRSRKTYWGK